jgi:hypothetical protein
MNTYVCNVYPAIDINNFYSQQHFQTDVVVRRSIDMSHEIIVLIKKNSSKTDYLFAANNYI